jgi:serine/threonine protein kinase
MAAVLSLGDEQVALRGEQLTIGRDAACDITLEDTIASRRHAELIARGKDLWEIRDLNSANGTRVNSQPVREGYILEDGDAITIGGSLLVYLDPDTAGTRTAQFDQSALASSGGTDTSLTISESASAGIDSDAGSESSVASSIAKMLGDHPERLLGQEVEGYKLEGILGRGAFGTVYRAVQIKMEREVAFKVIPTDDPEMGARAIAEAQLAGAISHSGIARVDSCGQADGYTWYSTELIEGHTLQQLLRRDGPFNAQRATMVAYRVAKAMAAATEKGIVHRDIKPANIMISLEGQIKIMDLGLALVVDPEKGIKGDGTIAGTPNYISPEQLTERIADQRSDIYSLGCTLFHLMSTKPPYQGKTAKETLKLHLHAPLPKLSETTKLVEQESQIRIPNVPKPLETLVVTMMQKNPDFRQQTWNDLIQELKELREYLSDEVSAKKPNRSPAPEISATQPAADSSDERRSSVRRPTGGRSSSSSDPMLKFGIILGVLMVIVVILMIVRASLAGE